MDCFMIGRDLVRLLQNVARIPEFEQLWRDILHNPQVLSPQFTGTHLPPPPWHPGAPFARGVPALQSPWRRQD
ncbi:hypothetical protein WISP_00149 [Willisornis vidua]|uniref:Integrator complex subunit 3 N-terminal domain-containing protein n=1 Tax=Willisornis vidua TaxID=1566151 RepID=A0ABQ9CKN6_9PASS|nr:hypothetical protein WISP_00149 [Willisornis vidua]